MQSRVIQAIARRLQTFQVNFSFSVLSLKSHQGLGIASFDNFSGVTRLFDYVSNLAEGLRTMSLKVDNRSTVSTFHFPQRITDEMAPEVQEFLVIHLEGPPVSASASSSSPQVRNLIGFPTAMMTN